jgi:hypothetical protein
MGKRNGKKKRISLLTGPGGNSGPAGGHAGRRPSSARQREQRGDGAVGAGPRASEGEKNGVRG